MVRDTWLVSDGFLRDMWTTIIGTKNKARLKNLPLPYIFDKYNVLPLYAVTSSLNKSTLGRMFNQFFDGLNDNAWLPKYIFFMPDKDLIESIQHYGFGCKIVFNKVLTWFAKNVESTLETRKDDISGKRSGAFTSDTTLVWIKMINRPYLPNAEKPFIFAQCNIFNTILQSVMSRFPNTKVVSVYFPEDPSLFDATGQLSSNGKTHFWKELNRCVTTWELNADESVHQQSRTRNSRDDDEWLYPSSRYKIDRHRGRVDCEVTSTTPCDRRRDEQSHPTEYSSRDTEDFNRFSLENAFHAIKRH